MAAPDMSGWPQDTRVKQPGASYLHRIRKSPVDNLTTAFDTWARGDLMENPAPSDKGTAGSRYVVRGWLCTVSGYGADDKWVECRSSTGS